MADLEKVKKGLRFHAGMCSKDCPYREIDFCVDDLYRDTLELLEEQEAVEPIYNEEKYGDHLPHCGNCEKVLPNNAVYGKVNFCHYCGRAVKLDERKG